MIIDYDQLKHRIRHYLLQQSDIYRRSVTNQNPDASMVNIARELNKKCDVGVRRLQKYLSERSHEKELSFNLEDLASFAQIKGEPLSGFVSYLLGEGPTAASTVDAKYAAFFNRLSLATRRELSLGLFSGNDLEKSTMLLGLFKGLYTLPEADIAFVQRIIDSLNIAAETRELEAPNA